MNGPFTWNMNGVVGEVSRGFMHADPYLPAGGS